MRGDGGLNSRPATSATRVLLWLSFLSILTYGFCSPLISTLLPRLQEVFSLRISQSGWIGGAMALGFVLATLGGGWIADAAGLIRTVSAGLVLMAIGLASVGLARGVGPCLVGGLAFGLGAGFSEVAGSAVISEVAGGRRRAMLNLSQFFWGLGAFASPHIAGRLAQGAPSGWRHAFLLAAPVALVLGIIVARYRGQRLGASELSGIRLRRAAGLLRCEPFVLLALCMFLYVAAEQGIGQWLPTYVQRTRGLAPGWGRLALSAYWGAVAFGRLFLALVDLRTDDLSLVRGASALSVLAALGLLLVTSPGGIVAFALLTGLLNAALWPTIMAATGARFRDTPGTAFGVVAGTGALGWLLVQPLIGVAARCPFFGSESHGLGVALFIVPACLCLLVAAVARLQAVDARETAQEGKRDG